jgi:ribosomal protein RSM22 (predicted rRNA methylase)
VAQAFLGPSDATGNALSERVAQLSRVYTKERDAIGTARTGRSATAARLRFFLPRDMPKVGPPLSELVALDALPKRPRLRVLDLGAGMGATTFGVALLARTQGVADNLDVLAVDADNDGLAIMERLAQHAYDDGLARIELRTRTMDLEHLDLRALDGPYDLILLGFVLNELFAGRPADEAVTQGAALLARLSGLLTDNGSMLVLEPALRPTSRALHRVRDQLAASSGPPFVFAPCTHARPCPMLGRERDWCHEDVDFALVAPLATVARSAGLRAERLTFSYLTLRRDARSIGELAQGHGVPLRRVVSAPMPTKGKLEMLVCGQDGMPRLMRLDRHHTENNAALDQVRRGDLVIVHAIPAKERLRVDAATRVEHPQAHIGTE